ncbi:phosphotransferase [Allokutzneria sp. NRRL B-24872]|uniref:phosphotransferase n=1 Tax=Allokutzneria sp. NRRL B-24872 TaxID=1137961 RepID=UPI000A37C888|nr:phosphotransferase [Allokutzneria sp. NRRL B-24872]
MTDTSKHVITYGTGNSTTVVRDLGKGRFHWQRSAGATNTGSLILAPVEVLAAAASANDERVRFTVAEQRESGLSYELPSPVSIGWWLLTGEVRPDQAADVVRAAGAAVRRLHGTQPPPGFLTRPEPVKDLADWMDGGSGRAETRFFHSTTGERLGGLRWELLRSWAADILAPAGPAVLTHGALVPNTVVASDDRARVELLTGTQLCLAPPAYDIGTFLADLAGMRSLGRFGVANGAPPLGDLTVLGDALLDGYGGSPDPKAVGRVVCVAYLDRLRGYTAHLGWTDFLLQELDRVAALIDSGGRDWETV